MLGAAQAGRPSTLKMLQLLRDEELIAQARQEATTVVHGDPWLARHGALSAAIDALLGDQRAEYLDKAWRALGWRAGRRRTQCRA